ncbi:putative amidoligase enzyme-domain-containing protein [Nemania abortiva]|nr:putative amidoligase enzyme-domain-containing protein [Nemania abortiva]
MGLFSKAKSPNDDEQHARSPARSPLPPPPPPPPAPGAVRFRPQVPATTHPSPARAPLGTIGVGIETEFILQSREPGPSDGSLRLFARALAANYNQSVPPSNPRMDSLVQNLVDGPPHMAWKLVHDPTCETDSSPWGIEMVSPIFRLMPDSSWRAAVRNMWEFLQENYNITANETCSTHVHMSIVGNYSVMQVKRLAQAIIHFEPAFEALLPRDRRGNEYARSNWIDNLHFGYAKLSRADAIAMLESRGTVDEVINLMNPEDSRYFGWNFQAIKKYSTVEFRRGAASTSSTEVFRWVELATSFLRASIKTPTAASIQQFQPTIGGLMKYLSVGVDDVPGVGESRYLWDKFAGLRPNDRLDPIPVGKLSPEKRKKLERKILLDKQSNPALDNIVAAKTQGLI